MLVDQSRRLITNSAVVARAVVKRPVVKRAFAKSFARGPAWSAVLSCILLLPATVPAEDTSPSIVAHSNATRDRFEPDIEPPVAAFSMHPVEGASSRQISLDAAETSDNVGIVSYQWRFGDGTSLSGSRAVSVVHTYPSGEYIVSLTVIDAAGLSSTHSHVLASEVGRGRGGYVAGRNNAGGQLAQVDNSTVKPVVPGSGQTDAGTEKPASTSVVTQDKAAVPEPEPSVAALAIPSGIAPKQDEIIRDGATTRFIWKHQATADLYDFRILNAASDVMVRIGEFSARSICSGERCQLTQELDLATARDYSWQVRAHNRAGWTDWSASRFNVLPPGLSKPKMPLSLFPGPDSSVNNDETITFLWEHNPAVDNYRFQLLDRKTGKILVDTKAHSRMFCDPAQCAYSRPVNLPAGDSYAWQIQAQNPAGESGWFRTSFEVVRNDKQPKPVAAFSYSLAGTDPMSVAFNASGSSGSSALSTYSWSFGDGSRQVQVSDDYRVSHQYSRGGSYLVELTVTDETGVSDTTQQLINVGEGTVPEAHFLVDGFDRDASGPAPLIVTFDPSGSSDDSAIVDYTWDFGDGSPLVNHADAAIVSHSYTGAGEFTVALTVTDDSDLKTIHTRLITVQDSVEALSITEAGRFLSHATFGANDKTLERLMETGYEAWLDEQFRLRGAAHLDYVKQFSTGAGNAARHEIWWQDVVHGEDQLRQRVAFALSQLFPLSDALPGMPAMESGVTAYYDVLREHAFGNYRDLLEAVTLNPVMGLHSGLLANAGQAAPGSRSGGKATTGITRVDEGFARMLLQRFTLGDVVLEDDGTATRLPAFSARDVHNIARALTGWNLHGATEWDTQQQRDAGTSHSISGQWERPMQPFESYHDRDSKQLPGGELTPPDLTAQEDLTLVLDNLFSHPNVGPFVAKALIRKLVSSNPTPAYVKRIAAVFADNGVGVRGDLRAVVRSILLDTEARTFPRSASFGKLREPVMRLAHLWRAFGVQPGTASERGEFDFAGIALEKLARVTGQSILSAPALQGFFASAYAPAGPIKEAGLAAPGFRYFAQDRVLSTASLLNRQIQRHYSGTAHSDDLQSAYLDFSPEYALAEKPKALLRRLDRLLLAGTMSTDLFEILHEHIASIPDTVSGRVTRVHDAVSLIVQSPDYLVQM